MIVTKIRFIVMESPPVDQTEIVKDIAVLGNEGFDKYEEAETAMHDFIQKGHNHFGFVDFPDYWIKKVFRTKKVS